MRGIIRTSAALVVLSATAVVAPTVRAEEVKAPVSASLILDLLSQPRERREAAFDQSLREDGPPRARSTAEVVLSRVVVTVRNPCPPGTAHYEPPPLPGRRK